LSMMRVGGNAPCKAFFESNGVVGMPLLRKYESDVAGAYRAKIIAQIEGKPWTDPKTPEEFKQYRISSISLTASGSSVSKPITPRSPETPGSYLRAPTSQQNYAPAPNYSNPSYSRYGNGSSFSSDDCYNNSRSGYQDVSFARNYHSNNSKGLDLDKLGNMLQEEGQKGLNLAVKYFNKARLLTGNGYGDLDKSNSLLGHAAGSGTRYTSGSNERNTFSSPSNADFYRNVGGQPRTTPPNQVRGGRMPPVQNRPPAAVAPSPPIVDEGGWDLSAWEDNQYDYEQPVTNQAPVANTKQNVKVSDSVDDLWDFGSKSKQTSSTVPHNAEANVTPKTENNEASQIPNESSTPSNTEQKEPSIPPIEDRENTPQPSITQENEILPPTTGQNILPEENTIMT
jgi:hypothetical protein